ncbi:hypothetical protein INR49_005067 [Caranx melampygus]|nr:hypothetical protein INR49_005067 [Caranx melampygus]
MGCTREEIPDIPGKALVEKWRLSATARAPPSPHSDRHGGMEAGADQDTSSGIPGSECDHVLRGLRGDPGCVEVEVNIAVMSLDELDDDDAGEKDRREEEELVQANTFQNEAMTADPATGHLMDTPRCGTSRHKR